jgi:hypothetical protein
MDDTNHKTPAMRLWEIENKTALETAFADLATMPLTKVCRKWGLNYPTAYGWAKRLGYNRQESWSL